jgi:hypothetical protein
MTLGREIVVRARSASTEWDADNHSVYDELLPPENEQLPRLPSMAPELELSAQNGRQANAARMP